jgi:hypothetical protein
MFVERIGVGIWGIDRLMRMDVNSHHERVWAPNLHTSIYGRPVCIILSPFATMAAADIYGFAHEDLETARRAIERALSIRLEEAQESMPPGGCYYRGSVPSGP